MNIYVGNLSREVTEEELKKAFEEFGKVASVTIIKDRFSNESRGFGFVEMPTDDEANAAISGLNGKQFKGRSINVNKANPRTERSGGGGGRDRDRRGGSRGRF